MKEFGILIRLYNHIGIEMLNKEYVVKEKKYDFTTLMQKAEELFTAEFDDVELPYMFGVRGMLEGETLDSYPAGENYSIFRTSYTSCLLTTTEKCFAEWRKKEQQEFLFNGEMVYAKINIYQKGFGFSIGKKSQGGLYGVKNHLYMSKITSRKFISNNSLEAMCFDSHSHTKALKYLEDHIQAFQFMHDTNGYIFEYKPTNSFAEAENADRRGWTPKQREAFYNICDILHCVNNNGINGTVYPDTEEGVATIDEMKAEAMRRLQVLGADIVANAFRKGKLFRSEYAGIVYDINDDEKQRIAEIESSGNLVYHIIKGQYTMSDGSVLNCSDFLVVSKNKEEWSFERPDGVDNYVDSWCESYGDIEIGQIKIEGCNGGIRRTA